MVGKSCIRPILLHYITTAGIFAAFAFMVGCGSTDPLDETGARFRVDDDIFVTDGGRSDNQVDIEVTACTGDPEELTDAVLVIPVVSDDDMDTDGYIYRVDLDFTPNTFFTDSSIQFSARVAANGGTRTLLITLLSPAGKAAYLGSVGAGPTTVEVAIRAYVTYTPHFPELHETVPLELESFTLQEVDDCPSSS